MVVPSLELDTKTTANLQELLWLSLSSCDYAPKEHCYMTQSYFQHSTFEPRSSEDQATRTLNIWDIWVLLLSKTGLSLVRSL